jgi:hypothetical protein
MTMGRRWGIYKADYQGNPLGENRDIVGSLVGTIDSIDLDFFS